MIKKYIWFLFIIFVNLVILGVGDYTVSTPTFWNIFKIGAFITIGLLFLGVLIHD